ncbi:MAG: hypothetical protein ACI4GW_00935 [Lachnospiraceae bacterium]
MRKELELKLQDDFLFMKQNNDSEENTLYGRWGCECSSGWYDILYDCCTEIMKKYEEYGVEIDFVPVQIKEKFGTLRFYYGYEDAPCGIAAFDFIGSGMSVRFEPENGKEGLKEKLRKEIAEIVRNAEERSKTTCEWCGTNDTAILRSNLGGRVLTLCDSCAIQYIKRRDENRRARREELKAICEEIRNKDNN